MALLHLKTWPDIADRVLRTSGEQCYMVWLLARALDKDGSGSVPIALMRRAVVDHGLFNGGSTSALDRHIRKAKRQDKEGRSWVSEWKSAQGERMIAYRSTAQICALLGIPRLRRAAIRIPLDALAASKVKKQDGTLKRYGTLKHFRAYNTLAPYYLQRKGLPSGAASTQSATDVSRSSQYDYRMIIRAETVRHVKISEYRLGDVVERERGEYCYQDRAGELKHVRPLPNGHIVKTVKRCKPGRIRKINRELKRLVCPREIGGTLERAKQKAQRLYFRRRDHARAASRKLSRPVLALAPYRHHGRIVWRPIRA